MLATVAELVLVHYGLLQVGVVALSILCYFPARLRLNRSPYRTRQRWHTRARLLIFVIFVVSFIPYHFPPASLSGEAFGLAAILVTLFASIIQPLYTPFDDRMKIHVAIPSLRPFNNAIRTGLYQTLSATTAKYVIQDDRSSLSHYDENHARLNDLTYAAVRDRADFFVAHPATEAAASDPIFVKHVTHLLRHGCHVFLIENFHGHASGLHLRTATNHTGRLIRVQSDSRAGAKALASYVRHEHEHAICAKRAFIVLMSGPQESRNAKARRDTFIEEFSDVHSFCEMPSLWWGVSSGRQTMLKLLQRITEMATPLDVVVIAGNDDMALGACAAITSQQCASQHRITVYGYDGILPARYAIGQNTTPFAATVHITPEEYGQRIGEQILSFGAGDVDAEDIIIPVTSSKITDKARCADELGLA